MVLLDARSILRLACVCRRLHALHSHEYAWQNVDLSTLAKRLDVRRLKSIIHHKLPISMSQIRIVSEGKSKHVVNEKAMDDLFIKCPNIKTLILEFCDLTEVCLGMSR